MVEINFNPHEHEPQEEFRLVSPGWYTARITGASVDMTKSGGQMLTLTFQPAEAHHPEISKRIVWHRLNLVNKNPKAEAISKGQLSAICRAMGQTSEVTDTDVLYHRDIAVKIGVEKDKSGNYPDKNKIFAFDSVSNRFGKSAEVDTPNRASEKPPTRNEDERPW